MARKKAEEEAAAKKAEEEAAAKKKAEEVRYICTVGEDSDPWCCILAPWLQLILCPLVKVETGCVIEASRQCSFFHLI